MARPVVHDATQTPPVSRPSPLSSRYRGFLIGQELRLAFAAGGGAGAGECRHALRACLAELAIDVEVPTSPRDGSHAALISALLPRLARHGRELADFTILGGLLTHYALAARTDGVAAAALLADIERLRAVYDLPPLDLPRFAAASGGGDVGRIRAPGLAYLAGIMARLPAEADTALVMLPAAPAYRVAADAFHRLALEHGGYRVLRTWASLGGDAAADLRRALVGRAGLLWADVSAPDPDAVATLGVAQALGTPAVAVAHAARAPGVPGHVGHAAVIRYHPAAADWPEAPAVLMAACLAGIALAAQRGIRLRLAPGSVEDAFDAVSDALGRILLCAAARQRPRGALAVRVSA